MAKDKEYRRLIHARRWAELRRWKLRKEILCERCKEKGLLTAAIEVHHIVPVETGLSLRDKEALMYSPTNLMALCHGCHVEVHKEMGKTGGEQNKREGRDKLRRFEEKFL